MEGFSKNFQTNEYNCNFCNSDFNFFDDLKNHFHEKHSFKTLEKRDYECCKVGCEKKFKCLKYMYTHIQNSHVSKKNASHLHSLDSQKRLSHLVASLRTSTNILTGVAIDECITQSHKYSCGIIDDTKSLIKDFIDEKGSVTRENLHELCNLINLDGYSRYLGPEGHTQAVKENFAYIEPLPIPLGRRTERQKNPATGRYELKQVYENFQYVPILKTLDNIIKVDKIREHIDNEPESAEGILEGFRDGKTFKDNPLFQNYPTALRLQIYFDELLVNNPLGTKTYAHKIGAFYFSVLNLPKEINSYLGGIFLFALCYNSDIAAYGISRILGPFMRDLAHLESEEGWSVKLNNGNDYILRGTIANVSADGLAVHEMFGLLSPSANRFCRLCMITRNELHEKPYFLGEPRTRNLYDDQLNKISEGTAQPKDFGIKGSTVLNNSRYFHVTSNYVFDPMHDCLEGVCQMVIKLVLAHLILSGQYDLNINTLNNRIHDFNYGFADQKVKPSANFTREMLMSKGNKIKQKAMQTWCLTRILPFLLSDILDKNNEYLGIMILLNQILEIVFAPVLSKGAPVYLDYLIKRFDTELRYLFGKQINIPNKVHHLAHYAQCIIQSGPMPQLACFRYEMKHIRMQRYGKICCNYKNIVFSLAKMCQFEHCSIWDSKKFVIREKIKFGSGVKTTINNLASCQKFLDYGYEKNVSVTKCKSVEVYGSVYKISLFVALDSGTGTAHGLPTFGEIEEIIILNDKVILYCRDWPSLHLEESLNAYCIEKGDSHSLILTDNLKDCKTFTIWHNYIDNDSYICLRHILI